MQVVGFFRVGAATSLLSDLRNLRLRYRPFVRLLGGLSIPLCTLTSILNHHSCSPKRTQKGKVMNHDDHEPQQAPGVPDGSGQHPRSTGRRDVPPHAKPNATPSAEDFPQRSIGTGISSEQLRNDPVLLAQITAYLEENHLHVPLLMPDIDKMSELRSETPELYSAYVEALRSQTRADELTRTAPYIEPAKAARRGQIFGLTAVLAVLLLCGYLAFLGYVISASIIAGFDLVALASVFANGRRIENA